MAKQVFEGIKVADFAWMGVGPISTKYLADHGATVIHIESHTHPDPIRLGGVTAAKNFQTGIDTSAFPANYNSSKLCISLDMNKEKGKEIAWRLIKWADIMSEAFTPAYMKRLGLDYESVSKVKPDIIYFSTCQMGQYGPYSLFRGGGNVMACIAGFSHVTGWSDRGPIMPQGAYTDYVNPRYAAATIIAALEYRRRTGRGVYLDQSQFECGLHFLAPHLMDYAMTGRITGRDGNRHPNATPHGVYPCRGVERWVAIAVFTDEEWQSFCRVIGNPDWTRDPRFATLALRKENEDELDRLVGEWTKNFAAEQVEVMMQAAGVAANVVESTKDLFEDPQLKYRGHFRKLEHKVIGLVDWDGPCFRLSKTPDRQFAPPCLGEHNEYVYKEILGLSDDEIADLLVEHVITTPEDFPIPGMG